MQGGAYVPIDLLLVVDPALDLSEGSVTDDVNRWLDAIMDGDVDADGDADFVVPDRGPRVFVVSSGIAAGVDGCIDPAETSVVVSCDEFRGHDLRYTGQREQVRCALQEAARRTCPISAPIRAIASALDVGGGGPSDGLSVSADMIAILTTRDDCSTPEESAYFAGVSDASEAHTRCVEAASGALLDVESVAREIAMALPVLAPVDLVGGLPQDLVEDGGLVLGASDDPRLAPDASGSPDCSSSEMAATAPPRLVAFTQALADETGEASARFHSICGSDWVRDSIGTWATSHIRLGPPADVARDLDGRPYCEVILSDPFSGAECGTLPGREPGSVSLPDDQVGCRLTKLRADQAGTEAQGYYYDDGEIVVQLDPPDGSSLTIDCLLDSSADCGEP